MTHDARLPSRDRFEGYYAEPRAPWDIGRPQQPFVEAGEAVRILYGGSVKPENASEILAVPNVGGALVGGASLTAESFLGIVAAAAEISAS